MNIPGPDTPCLVTPGRYAPENSRGFPYANQHGSAFSKQDILPILGFPTSRKTENLPLGFTKYPPNTLFPTLYRLAFNPLPQNRPSQESCKNTPHRGHLHGIRYRFALRLPTYSQSSSGDKLTKFNSLSDSNKSNSVVICCNCIS